MKSAAWCGSRPMTDSEDQQIHHKAKTRKVGIESCSEAKKKKAAIPSKSSSFMPMSNYQEMKTSFHVKVALDFSLFVAKLAFQSHFYLKHK